MSERTKLLLNFSKRLISILMLLLIISHGSVHLFILKIYQTQHSKNIFLSIEKGMIKDDLILFKFNKYDLEKGLSYLEWIEENEFRIDGEMYDVVKREVKKDSIYLYCLHDKTESILYSGIVKIFNRLFGDGPGNDGNSTIINNLLSELYFNTATEFSKFYLEESNRYLPVKTFSLLDGEHFINTPPPRS
jgi:hypothetical protein